MSALYFTAPRSVPRLFMALWNQGYPASVAAEILRAYRLERCPRARHAIQIAYHERHRLKHPVAWVRRYR